MMANSLRSLVLLRSAAASLLLLAGCMSAPRPYDGVIGYRGQATPTGFDLSYVDEADVDPAKVLRKLQAVCAKHLQVEPAMAVVAVTGEETFQQDVPMSVAVPMAMQDNGRSSGSGPTGGLAKSLVMQNEGVMRLMTLRKVSASCGKASGS